MATQVPFNEGRSVFVFTHVDKVVTQPQWEAAQPKPIVPWQLVWARGVRKAMRETLRGRNQLSPIRSAFSLLAVVRVGIVAVAAGCVGCRDRRVLSNHPPVFSAQVQARTLESELVQLAAESPHLFPMGQPMILDGAQLSSLMETNGFRPVPRTPWGGAYTAVVCKGTQGMRSVVLFTEGKKRSTLW